MDDLIWRVHDYPKGVVDAIVYSIPEHVILNERSTFCDPAMGGGQFLRGILDRCVAAGQRREQVLPRLYGVERSIFYLNYAKWKNNLEGCIVTRCADIEKWDPQMKFDVIIGNPPYSDTKNVKGATSGGCSKGLDNQFFERSLRMADRVSLIIRSKYFAKKSAVFRRKLFSSGKLAEITALSPSVFPSISLTETCIVTYDASHSGPTKVTFQNGEVRNILLTADTCIKLTNPDYQPDAPNNLAARHLMGEVGLNTMRDGSCPMILTCSGRGKQIEVRQVAADQHVCGLNEHGVVMNRVYGGKGLGRVFVKPFDHSISRSAVMLRTSSERESEILRDYLLSEGVQNLINGNKISNVHSKELFRTITDPLIN